MKEKAPNKRDAEFPCGLRAIRKAQGRSIVGLARESGVASDKIIHIEMRKGEGKPSTHLKLAKALGVSLDEYFGFKTLEPVSNEPEMITSDSGVTVEQLAPLPGSEISVKRIILSGHKELGLTRYLNPKKPVFFYMASGESKLWTHQKDSLLKSGENLSLSLPGKVRVENLSSLPLTLLVIQP